MVAKLSTASHEHVELARIDRNFGKSRYLIVLDGWVPRGQPGIIADVRLWWLDQKKADARHPLERYTQRYVELTYQRLDPAHWTVTMRNSDRVYRFHVELGPKGRPRAYAPVVTPGGKTQRCQVRSARLEARRFLGIPTGVGEIALQCQGANGSTYHGYMPTIREPS